MNRHSKQISGQHLILYDGTCGFCNRVIQWILKTDRQKRFFFASLQGQTADSLSKKLDFTKPLPDSLILITNFESTNPMISYYSQAVFQIFWLLGRGWKTVGVLKFFPSFLFDWLYQTIASNRHLIFSNASCPIISSSDLKRFLP